MGLGAAERPVLWVKGGGTEATLHGAYHLRQWVLASVPVTTFLCIITISKHLGHTHTHTRAHTHTRTKIQTFNLEKIWMC